jgi:hypothetical protein
MISATQPNQDILSILMIFHPISASFWKPFGIIIQYVFALIFGYFFEPHIWGFLSDAGPEKAPKVFTLR